MNESPTIVQCFLGLLPRSAREMCQGNDVLNKLKQIKEEF